jgi:hypothetical protein
VLKPTGRERLDSPAALKAKSLVSCDLADGGDFHAKRICNRNDTAFILGPRRK